ncbi:RICIN domain-containing protein [Streptomyces melanogenes]|uniref:RICIN domain-containing protein n=1 Tax=Streptomyces melanogenes TaxID=67326 RepID=UPI00167F0045|nr:RICIN domain-containing protein [Streptomyces melanogenes]GGP91368.1 hypothetical protein GCM10010278_82040 [Streptomyces melanogenes]
MRIRHAMTATGVAALALLSQAVGSVHAADPDVTVTRAAHLRNWAESGEYTGSVRPAAVIAVPEGRDVDGQMLSLEFWKGDPGQDFAVYQRGDELVVSHNGYVLDQDVTKGKVQIWRPWQGQAGIDRLDVNANQRWRVLDKDKTGWSMIQNVATGKCLRANGLQAVLSAVPCDGNDAAQWWNQF